jgi:hypothetical protein
MKFVRFTYQECESVDGAGAYKALGMEQDIRLANGWFTIGEHRTGLQYNIREGKLYRVDDDRTPLSVHGGG